jgi:hypothetical protein
MKNILTAMLMTTSLMAAAKNDKETAFPKGTGTVMLGISYANTREDKWYTTATPPVFVAADYQFSKRFSVNMMFAIRYFEDGNNYGTISYSYWKPMLIPTLEYCYINSGKLRLSCGVGIGLSWETVGVYKEITIIGSEAVEKVIKNKREIAIARVRAIDMKWKLTPKFGVLAGLGYGTDGIINAGVWYKFAGNK